MQPAKALESFNYHALPPRLTTHEAAAILRVKPRTLWKWRAQGRGPVQPTSVCGRLLWDRDEVLAAAGIEVAS